MNDDTIAAISSAVGQAPRMIVRASGVGARGIHAKLTGSNRFVAFLATQQRLGFAGASIPAWVYCFEAPASVTGEDVLELHIPGNPLLARLLLDKVVRLGARQAQPGEFSARAYFNGKMDLAEAEGVAATIAAHSERELLAARQLMAGELAHRLRPLLDSLADTLALIEAGIDFADQEISFLTVSQIQRRISDARDGLSSLLKNSTRLEKLSHEPQIVLTGRPNAGKSTLLNALAGQERAIVSPIAGTTRDVLTAQVRLPRGFVQVIDAAGLGTESSSNLIDRAMQEQAMRAIEQADRVVFIQEVADSRPPMNLSRTPDLHILTKLDLHPDWKAESSCPAQLAVSAVTGEGMIDLRTELDNLSFGRPGSEATLALNARHVGLIEEASQSLARAGELLPGGGLELLAMELREALDSLGAVLGSVTPDDVLGRVFSRFCIGK